MKDNTKPNQHKDVAESARVNRKVRAKAQQCYLNAWRVIQHVPGYDGADYVEGIAVLESGLCIEHGWVEKGGVIVDPTVHEDDMIYFPGLRFKGQRGQAEALRIPNDDHSEELPIFYRFGWGGIDSPEFRSALVAAYRFAGDDYMASRYEEYRPRYTRSPTGVIVLCDEIAEEGERVLLDEPSCRS